MNIIDDVEKFHKKFGVPVKYSPEFPSNKRRQLRVDLIFEEYTELMTAIWHEDMLEIADGIADLIYVLAGTALEYGVPLDAVWNEVQRTNMLKIKNGENKVMKPEGWVAPRIKEILDSHSQKHIINNEGWNPEESKEI